MSTNETPPTSEPFTSEEITEALAEELAHRKGVRLKRSSDKNADASDLHADSGEHRKKPRRDAPTDFSRYLMTIGNTVQVALGRIPDPTTEQYNIDLDVSSEFINLLSILQEKTKGNLSSEEEGFLNALLYELRLQHVAVRKKLNDNK